MEDTCECECDCDWLNERLSNPEYEIIVLDCRPLLDYRRGHITGAVHLAVPSLMLRRLKSGSLSVSSVISYCQEGKERLSNSWRSCTLVLLDESSSDNTSAVIHLLLKSLKDYGCRVRVLGGGFSTFQSKYPGLCITSQENPDSLAFKYLQITSGESGSEESEDPPSPDNSSFPVKVLPYLYLGSAQNSADLENLQKNNIRYILNVTANVPNKFESNSFFRYMQIPISDHWSQDLISHIDDAIHFIDEGRREKCGVLVHCLAGISRSAAITVAYLMHALSLSLNDAYDHVKRCKPNVSPNFNFMGQLMDYERQLRLERDTYTARLDLDNPDDIRLWSCINPKVCFSSPDTCSSLSSLSSSSASATATSSSSFSASSTFDYDISSPYL